MKYLRKQIWCKLGVHTWTEPKTMYEEAIRVCKVCGRTEIIYCGEWVPLQTFENENR